jgi:hypothetical protein
MNNKSIYTKSTIIALIGLASLLSFSASVWAEEFQIEFIGIPERVTAVGYEKTIDKNLSDEETREFICVIKKFGDRYYWASRENREVLKVPSGAFTNYMSLSGAGYVKVINQSEKSAASLLGETEAKFDYVEHLVTGLKAITYYGKQSN